MKAKAKIKRKYRLKKAIKSIVENHLKESYFITMTFNDKMLLTKTKKQRLQAVERYLNNQTDKYILNCDYGAKNKREHYHALSIAKDKFINFSLYTKKYGNIKVLPLNLYKTQTAKSKIDYLLNHALKETSESKIIYSKSKRKTHKKKDTKIYKLVKQSKADEEQQFLNFLDAEFIEMQTTTDTTKLNKAVEEISKKKLTNKTLGKKALNEFVKNTLIN